MFFVKQKTISANHKKILLKNNFIYKILHLIYFITRYPTLQKGSQGFSRMRHKFRVWGRWGR